jgi:hypothetical protein
MCKSAHHGKTAVHEEHKVGRSQDEADVDILIRPRCEVRDRGIDGSLLVRVEQAFKSRHAGQARSTNQGRYLREDICLGYFCSTCRRAYAMTISCKHAAAFGSQITKS